jgi:hypothetical protein
MGPEIAAPPWRWSSAWIVRLVCVAAGCSLPSAAVQAEYTARLYFENLSTGLSGAGAVEATPGDQMAIRYQFHGWGDQPRKWGILQLTLCQNAVLTSEDGATWESQLTDAVVPTEHFPIRLFIGDKDLYDSATDPLNNLHDFVCHGCYALVGARGDMPESSNWDVTLFRFSARGNFGDELGWTFDGRCTNFGLTTRILDAASNNVDVTDNFVRIVPEPGGWTCLALGAAGLMALRRRRP